MCFFFSAVVGPLLRGFPSGLRAECHFDDVFQLCRDRAGHCVAHGRQCSMPTARPDLLVMGFSCPPYSRAGRGRSGRPAEDHMLFGHTAAALEFAKTARPRALVCENVCGFCDTDAVGRPSHLERFEQALQREGYHVASVVLDSSVWVPLVRQRVWIVALDGACAAQERVLYAIAVMRDLEDARRQRLAPKLSHCLMEPNTREWWQGLAGTIHGTRLSRLRCTVCFKVQPLSIVGFRIAAFCITRSLVAYGIWECQLCVALPMALCDSPDYRLGTD